MASERRGMSPVGETRIESSKGGFGRVSPRPSAKVGPEMSLFCEDGRGDAWRLGCNKRAGGREEGASTI